MKQLAQEAWRTYFDEYGYKPLIQINDELRSLKIEEFCNEDGSVPEELKEIYLFCNKANVACELLLVLDIGKKQEQEIKPFCKEWNERILSFLNFGALPGQEQQSLYLLKYNVIQILLSDFMIEISDSVLSEEKSTDISRKIFISVDENGSIVENDRFMLPFYFDQLILSKVDLNAETELAQMLPKSDELAFLYEPYTSDKDFPPKDLAAVKEWLNNVED